MNNQWREELDNWFDDEVDKLVLSFRIEHHLNQVLRDEFEET